jgi:hypothetical protein
MKIYQTESGSLFYVFIDNDIYQIYIDEDGQDVIKAKYFKVVLLEHIESGIQQGLLNEYKGDLLNGIINNLIK